MRLISVDKISNWPQRCLTLRALPALACSATAPPHEASWEVQWCVVALFDFRPQKNLGYFLFKVKSILSPLNNVITIPPNSLISFHKPRIQFLRIFVFHLFLKLWKAIWRRFTSNKNLFFLKKLSVPKNSHFQFMNERKQATATKSFSSTAFSVTRLGDFKCSWR